MARRDALLDTGVLVGFLNSDEDRHRDCLTVMAEHRGKLLTTEAVVTEAMHLLHREAGVDGMLACTEFVLREACSVVPMSLSSLERCKKLMSTYADTPMDYADATLVSVAEDFNIRRVLTLDPRGFEAYRLPGRHRFEILP